VTSSFPLPRGKSYPRDMRRSFFRFFLGFAFVGAAASLGFFIKVCEEDAVMNTFLADTTKGVPRSDPEAVALAVARTIHQRTGVS